MADDLSARVLNAGATSQWITLAVGANTAVNHPFPSSKRLTPGEILRVDVGGTFQGYQSDVARTAAIATVNPSKPRCTTGSGKHNDKPLRQPGPASEPATSI